MAALSDPVFDRFLKRFEADVLEKVEAEIISGRLHDEGRVRSSIRNDLDGILRNNLEHHDQMKLALYCGKMLLDAAEFPLARDCFQYICDACNGGQQENLDLFRIHIEAQHSVIACDNTDIVQHGSFQVAPMRVSRLLACLNTLRGTLDSLLYQPVKVQEDFAWLILNGCKLVYSIGHPLLSLDCGKYVHESLMFASLCMDAVINLSTMRHLNFKMKLWTCAFNSLILHNSYEEAFSFLQHIKLKVAELREREELDPPLLQKIDEGLMRAEMDIIILAEVLKFWHDPDSLDLLTLDNPFPTLSSDLVAPNVATIFSEKCLLECIRVQELTAGNSNEPWRKRSSSILKAFLAFTDQFLEQEKSQVENEVMDEEEKENMEEIHQTQVVGVECLVSVMGLAMFDELEGVDNVQVLEQVRMLEKRCHDSTKSELSQADFDVLDALTLFVEATLINGDAVVTINLLEKIHGMIHSDRLSGRTNLLRKLSLALWSKSIYPALQGVLSSVVSAEFPSGELTAIVEPLTTTAISLIFSGIEDPVLVGGVSIILSQLLNFMGESRRSISFLVKAVEYIDECRAARVDIGLHFPDDVSDIKALQYSSFTCRSDHSHMWHASAKRLGAHAFAGFGIFGSMSSMASVDQALCDIHLDLLCLLFRFEIIYAVSARNKSNLLKASTAQSKTAAGKGSTVDFVSTSSTVASHPNIDRLSCISNLRSSWGKSTYSRSILLVEMARLEKKPEKQLEYLQEAVDCVEEAEKRELDLQAGFANLTVVSESTAMHPIVLSRSHSFFYVSPVGCKKQGFEKAHHYRVFGREEGSGTDISITSDELGGCDELISIDNMISPTSCAVRISTIRSGEKYSFACAGFSKDGKLIGSISPTCQSIEATNPLPVVSLWGNICLLAYEIGEYDLSKRMSSKVCDYYIKLAQPKQENRTFGKGINSFSHDRYFLNMLALQQASPVQLVSFVKCFLVLDMLFAESLRKDPLVDSTSMEISAVKVHWSYKASVQFKIATNCHKLALVTGVASTCQDHSLIVKCVCLGYTLISQSMLFDVSQVAHVLLNPILVFLTALKVTPKPNWECLDHQLYCRLFLYAIKCAVANGNYNALSSLLSDFYPMEESHGELPMNILSDYSYLMTTMTKKVAVFATDDILKQLHELLSLRDFSGENLEVLDETDIWNLSNSARNHLVKNVASGLVNGHESNALVEKVMVQLEQAPPSTSQLIDVLVSTVMQLYGIGKHCDVSVFLSTYPLRKDYLASAVSEDCEKLEVDFLSEPPRNDEDLDENDEKKDEEVGIDDSSNPIGKENHFLVPPVSEIREQFRSIAHLCTIQADSCFSDEKIRNEYPQSNEGPFLQLSEKALESGLEELAKLHTDRHVCVENDDDNRVEESTATNDEGKCEDIQAEDINEKCNYVKRLSTAIIFFVRANYFQSAIDSMIRIWNFIADQWYSPVSFAAEFSSLKGHLLGVVGALVQILETQCSSSESNLTTECDILFHPRIVKQNLYVLRHPITFLMKCLCLLDLHKELVEVGLRVLDVYIHHGAEYSNIVCDHCSKYLLFSQEEIIAKNTGNVSYRAKKLDSYIAAWDEMQAKKRKKKMRVVKVEKSDEELRFEAEKATLSDKLERSKTTLEFSQQKRDFILQIEKRVDGANTTGQQIFDKVRKSSTAFIDECRGLMRANPGKFPSFKAILNEKSELKKFHDIVGHYDQVATFLREKKDTINLVSALHEEGDFYLLFGFVDMSCNVWRDGVDGYFNVLDAWKDWQDIAGAAVRSVDLKTAGCVLTVISVLAKLSKHCSVNDADKKSNYCQLAATLCLIPFKETLNHPVDLHGFAAYSCHELGGKVSLEFDDETYSAFSFHNALEEIVSVLGSESMCLPCLPVLVLQEHYHGVYSCSLEKWLTTRLRRVRFLVELHFFSEATSMLSSILPTLLAIKDNSYSDLLVKASALENSDSGDENRSLSHHEVISNGFEFCDCPPFYNNIPVDDELNQQSVSWIASFPDLFLKMSEKFIVVLPPSSEVTEPPPEVVDEVVTSGKKKGKGKKMDDSPEVEEVKKSSNSRPLFSRLHLSEVFFSCAAFLTELSSIDSRVTVEHHHSLEDAMSHAVTLLDAASCFLQPDSSTTSVDANLTWNDSRWVRLYGGCHLLHSRQLFQKRQYRACRSNCLQLVKDLGKVSNVFAVSKFEMTHLWFSTKLLLVHTAECQARFEDILTITAQSSGEASTITSSFWCRRFVYYKALSHYKLGDVEAAEDHCRRVSDSYGQSRICDLGSVRTELLKASILHAKLHVAGMVATEDLASECVDFLRSAHSQAEVLCERKGFVGNDSNLTYASVSSSLMKHDRFTPFINGVTILHVNYPDMSPPSTRKGAGRRDRDFFKNKTLRAGPIDVLNTYTQSQLCNIYFEEVRMLALCSSSLCLMLDEVRVAGVFSKSGSDSASHDSTLLKEQILTSEAGLKILRHVVFPSSFVKASLFLSAGKGRIEETSRQCLEGEFPGCQDFLSPLVGGLEVCMNGPHQWNLMKLYCLEIIECYGNHSLFMDLDTAMRLKMAVKYLLLCARLDNIQFDVEYNVLSLLEKASLVDAVCPEDIEGLLTSITSSSLFSFGQGKELELTSASNEAGGKGKGKKEGRSSECKPFARDAFLILSSLSRENNPFVMDGAQFDFMYDLLRSIRKAFPQTEDLLFVNQLPQCEEDLVVTEASVTCVWAASRGKDMNDKRMLFPSLTGYILLGGLKENTLGNETPPDFISEEPFLQKVSVDISALQNVRCGMTSILNRVTAWESNSCSSEEEGDELAAGFCGVLRNFLCLLQSNEEHDEESRFNITYSKPTDEKPSYISNVALQSGAKVCSLVLTSEVIQQFIDISSQEKACYDRLCDKDVCLFFWGALRV